MSAFRAVNSSKKNESWIKSSSPAKGSSSPSSLPPPPPPPKEPVVNTQFVLGASVWIPNFYPQSEDLEDDDSSYRMPWVDPIWCGRPMWLPGVVVSDKCDGQGCLKVNVAITSQPATRGSDTRDVLYSDILHRHKEDPLEAASSGDRDKAVSRPPPSSPPSLDLVNQPTVDDMIDLVHLHDASVLDNIVRRFKHDQIYTKAGQILIAMNPYKLIKNWRGYDMDIYDGQVMKLYRNQPAEGERERELPPHVFEVARQSYTTLIERSECQSVVISGESGAGKTETAKLIMKFLANASIDSKVGAGDGGRDRRESIRAGKGAVEDVILESNPILEAFGNAKTMRNDNSSRFGKFIKIRFQTTGNIVDASIQKYLLEKSRVISQLNGERNYHIFYHLLKGSDEYEKERFSLAGIDDYQYLLGTKNIIVASMTDDVLFFREVKAALTSIGITDNMQEDLFSVVSSVLHLGNVSFQGEDTASCTTLSSLSAAARLMGMPTELLLEKLTFKEITVGGKTTSTPVKGSEAHASCGALAKEMYSRLFDWLVDKINESLSKVGTHTSHSQELYIGILDIFGFEVFLHNSFEQLCINYANEKLQQFFTNFVFKQEMELYTREGVDFSTIAFVDNSDVISLIEEKNTGLLALLDENCLFPRGTDASYHSKVKTAHGSNPLMGKFGFDTFVVCHSAAVVTYSVENFLEKNKDRLKENLLLSLKGSSNPLVAAVFSKDSTDAPAVAPSAGTERETRKRSASSSGMTGSSAFLGSKFKVDIGNLVSTLAKTSPHFIRCLKPNTTKQPGYIKPRVVLHQLVYLGVLDSIKIRHSGFGYRLTHANFYKRFQVITPSIVSKYGKDPVDSIDITECARLAVGLLWNLAEGYKDKEQSHYIQMGKTHVFIKRSFGTVIEVLRNVKVKQMNNAATTVQSKFKGLRQCRRYRMLLNKIAHIQAMWRGFYLRKQWQVRMHAIIKIQTRLRGLVPRLRFLTIKRASTLIQKNYRRYRICRMYRFQLRGLKALQHLAKGYVIRVRLSRLVEAARLVQRRWRGHVTVHRYLKAKTKAATMVQAAWRGYYCRQIHGISINYLKGLHTMRKRRQALVRFCAKYKMILIRRRFRHIKRSTVFLQRWWRARRLRTLHVKKIKSIYVLQRAVRCFLARRRTDKRRIDKELAVARWRLKLVREREALQLSQCIAQSRVECRVVDREGQEGGECSAFDIIDVDVAVDINPFYPEGWTQSIHMLKKHLRSQGERILSVHSGDTHTVAVATNGHLYSWGWGDLHQLGRKVKHNSCFKPSLVEDLVPRSDISHRVFISQVACGKAHTLARSQNGHVFSWGGNGRGQLGFGDSSRCATIRRVETLRRAASSVAAGASHSVALLEGGVVYAWGAKECVGVKGAKGGLDRYSPVGLKVLAKGGMIKSISAGEMFTVALSNGGDVYVWGEGKHGQLGLGDKVLFLDTPTIHPFFRNQRTVTILAGGRHTVALNAAGVIHTFGCNKYGQLGLGHCVNKFHPQVVSNARALRSTAIAVGWRQTACITREGAIYAWGHILCHNPKSFVHSVIDDNTQHSVLSPALVTPSLADNMKPTAIFCGSSSSMSYIYLYYTQQAPSAPQDDSSEEAGGGETQSTGEQGKSLWNALTQDISKVSTATFEVEASALLDDARSEISSQETKGADKGRKKDREESERENKSPTRASQAHAKLRKVNASLSLSDIMNVMTPDEVLNMRESYVKDLIHSVRGKDLGLNGKDLGLGGRVTGVNSVSVSTSVPVSREPLSRPSVVRSIAPISDESTTQTPWNPFFASPSKFRKVPRSSVKVHVSHENTHRTSEATKKGGGQSAKLSSSNFRTAVPDDVDDSILGLFEPPLLVSSSNPHFVKDSPVKGRTSRGAQAGNTSRSAVKVKGSSEGDEREKRQHHSGSGRSVDALKEVARKERVKAARERSKSIAADKADEAEAKDIEVVDLPVHPKTREETTLLIHAMRNNTLFQMLDETQLKKCLDAFERHCLVKETVVFREGDPGKQVFVVGSGSLAIFKEAKVSVSEEGVSVVERAPIYITELGRGAMFGEITLMTESPRTATVKAKADTTLWSLDRKSYRFIRYYNPSKTNLTLNSHQREKKMLSLMKYIQTKGLGYVANLMKLYDTDGSRRDGKSSPSHHYNAFELSNGNELLPLAPPLASKAYTMSMGRENDGEGGDTMSFLTVVAPDNELRRQIQTDIWDNKELSEEVNLVLSMRDNGLVKTVDVTDEVKKINMASKALSAFVSKGPEGSKPRGVSGIGPAAVKNSKGQERPPPAAATSSLLNYYKAKDSKKARPVQHTVTGGTSSMLKWLSHTKSLVAAQHARRPSTVDTPASMKGEGGKGRKGSAAAVNTRSSVSSRGGTLSPSKQAAIDLGFKNDINALSINDLLGQIQFKVRKELEGAKKGPKGERKEGRR